MDSVNTDMIVAKGKPVSFFSNAILHQNCKTRKKFLFAAIFKIPSPHFKIIT